MEKSKQARARERKLRAQYRRRLRVAIVLCLIIGLAGGFVGGRLSAGAPINPLEQINTIVKPTATPYIEVVSTPEATVAPTAEPTVEPTEAPTPAPTAEPTATPAPKPVEVIVPYGESQEVTVQAYSDGTVRKTADALPFENLSFSVRVTRHMTNDYYANTYGSTHRLTGSEAGVEFELLANDYMGTITLDPNKLLKNTGVEDSEGNVSLGYLFTDKEISGSDDFALTTNVPSLVYKRYNHSDAKIEYLVMTTYVDGVANVYKFELGNPEPVATPEPTVEPTAAPTPMTFTDLKLGSSGEEVSRLQNRLIELGYLAEGSADGAYGNMTYVAVMKAQRALGMTDDGVATPAFQEELFGAQAE